ncbi:MAG TPA: coproporphyrinogen dehydrogenase HemZ [Syntrophomonadaceae bacterium]|nr:coproporphyrinogen dehydrogenase HemZ [Syntrophomonadaceae bacterium]
MLISYNFSSDYLYRVVHELIRLAFPACILTKKKKIDSDLHIEMHASEEDDQLIMEGLIVSSSNATSLKKAYILAKDNQHNQINRDMRRFCFTLLSKHQGKPISTYGVLTGVRPLKLVHRLLDADYTANEIRLTLEKEFYLHPDKASLLTRVAYNNRPYLPAKAAKAELISVYIGIPYCPSRCYYCSFPGQVLRNYAQELPHFLEVLFTEIKQISSYLKANHIQVETIYIGGGTPTILTESDLALLLDVVNYYLISDATKEFTVEAGRPDTLNLSKLMILKDGGVNRVCINPQTMNDHTLDRIGRKHTSQETLDAVENARIAGIDIINMDIIVGLFEESKKEFELTAKKILEVIPKNVTVHTLALKKGSAMAENERNRMEMRIREVEMGVKYFHDILAEAGYIPYYLYRQKYMRGDMENLGYSIPNNFCLYNILMIEEKQTIIGFGGGAASKFVNPSDWSLESIYNPKEPQAYFNSMEGLVARKVDKLRGLN